MGGMHAGCAGVSDTLPESRRARARCATVGVDCGVDFILLKLTLNLRQLVHKRARPVYGMACGRRSGLTAGCGRMARRVGILVV